MSKELRRLNEMVGNPLASTSEGPLSESAMIGIKYQGSQRRPELVLRVRSCWSYDAEAEKTTGSEKGKKGEFLPKVDVWASAAGKKLKWATEFAKLVVPALADAVKKEGMFPTDPKGYRKELVCSGLAELGTFNIQNPYSDDAYVAIRAESDEIGKIILDALQKALPITGGGVPGSYGYKGHGAESAGNGVWIYHWSSFGIGD